MPHFDNYWIRLTLQLDVCEKKEPAVEGVQRVLYWIDCWNDRITRCQRDTQLDILHLQL